RCEDESVNGLTRTMAVLGFQPPGSVREAAPRVRKSPTSARIDTQRASEPEEPALVASAPQRARRATIALCVAFFVHLGIALWVTANHEPWRDEADIWLFGRDAPITDWWSFLRHSGHPGLWHLFVAGLTRTGLPYASMNFGNVAIVSLGIAIFLRFAR